MKVGIRAFLLLMGLSLTCVQADTPATSTATTPTDVITKPRVIVSVQIGNLHRLRLIDNDTSQIGGQFPVDKLKYFTTASREISFRLTKDGYPADSTPGFMSGYIPDPTTGPISSDEFYQAALASISKVKMAYIEGSWDAPINKFDADVIFLIPPCIAPKPRLNLDIQFAICASQDPTAKLAWEEKPIPKLPDAVLVWATASAAPGAPKDVFDDTF